MYVPHYFVSFKTFHLILMPLPFLSLIPQAWNLLPNPHHFQKAVLSWSAFMLQSQPQPRVYKLHKSHKNHIQLELEQASCSWRQQGSSGKIRRHHKRHTCHCQLGQLQAPLHASPCRIHRNHRTRSQLGLLLGCWWLRMGTFGNRRSCRSLLNPVSSEFCELKRRVIPP
jgi:hypothetical protein